MSKLDYIFTTLMIILGANVGISITRILTTLHYDKIWMFVFVPSVIALAYGIGRLIKYAVKQNTWEV